MFALLMEPYAMIQVSNLLSLLKQMGTNVAYMSYFYVSVEPWQPLAEFWLKNTAISR